MIVLRKPLKRYSTSGCVAHQTLSLITPMRRNSSVGVQGKAIALAHRSPMSAGCSPCHMGGLRLDPHS
jgi:hypothetical protein